MIKYVGPHPRGKSLKWGIFIMCYLFLLVLIFHRRVFGELRLLWETFFVWTTTLGKIFTLDNLRKMNVIVVDCCCMCTKSGESIDFVLHCEVAQELGSSLFHLFGIDWVMPRRVWELLVCWRVPAWSRNILEVWLLAPLCLMWCICREQNARRFEDREISVVELKNIMFKSLYTWIEAYFFFVLSLCPCVLY